MLLPRRGPYYGYPYGCTPLMRHLLHFGITTHEVHHLTSENPNINMGI